MIPKEKASADLAIRQRRRKITISPIIGGERQSVNAANEAGMAWSGLAWSGQDWQGKARQCR